MSTSYQTIASRIGSLVDTKAEAYGPALTNTAKHLEILWPNGIPAKDYQLAALFVRMLDKMTRGANGHLDDVGADLAGYGLMLEKMYQESKVKVVVGRENKLPGDWESYFSQTPPLMPAVVSPSGVEPADAQMALITYDPDTSTWSYATGSGE